MSNPHPSQQARRVVVLPRVRRALSADGTGFVERVIVSALGLSRLALLPINALARTLTDLTATGGRAGVPGVRRPAASPPLAFRRDPGPRPLIGYASARPQCRQASRT